MHSQRLKVLFVCTMNKWRSPTAESLYRSDPRLQVRSAGTSSSAKHALNEADIGWADVIFVMEREHKSWITGQFDRNALPKIVVLDIPDNYRYMDPVLQKLLRISIEPGLSALLPKDPAP